jgi:hypothetical protein
LKHRSPDDCVSRSVDRSPAPQPAVLHPRNPLRRVRLARAHDELVDAEPGATTAMAVAQRWGFTHYGRFAAQYRQRFGRSPGETLRGRATLATSRRGTDRLAPGSPPDVVAPGARRAGGGAGDAAAAPQVLRAPTGAASFFRTNPS